MYRGTFLLSACTNVNAVFNDFMLVELINCPISPNNPLSSSTVPLVTASLRVYKK